MEERAAAGLPAPEHRAELLIAEFYLAGVNTRRVRRALQTLSLAASARMPSAAPGTAPNRSG